MRNKISLENALLRMQALCSRSEHCEADIRLKLRSWLLPEEKIDFIIKSLVNEGFIDNHRFALAFAHDKYEFSHWGRNKIVAMLRSKGITENDIEDAIGAIPDDGYEDVVRDAVMGKYRQVKDKGPRLARAALIRFATSRGFEPRLFYPIINEILNTDDCCDEDWR